MLAVFVTKAQSQRKLWKWGQSVKKSHEVVGEASKVVLLRPTVPVSKGSRGAKKTTTLGARF